MVGKYDILCAQAKNSLSIDKTYMHHFISLARVPFVELMHSEDGDIISTSTHIWLEEQRKDYIQQISGQSCS